MAKQFATQELVFKAAADLLAEGVDPSLLLVQAKIGGGSYTTIKRYLDQWAALRASEAQIALDVPESVVKKSMELARSLWATAMQEAQGHTQAAKLAAELKVSEIGKELAFAQSEIGRLEALEEAQAQELERKDQALAQMKLDLSDAKLQLAKAADVASRLAATEHELVAARQQSSTHAVEAGRLGGEAQALAGQVRELTAALVSLKVKPTLKGEA
jgi:hypothetical protein